MMTEIARVLTADGVLVMSAPNPVEYSAARNYRNPFHLHEPDRAELAALLGDAFPVQRWFRQRRYFGSAVWSEASGESVEAWSGDAAKVDKAAPPAAMYFVVVAARSQAALPAADAALSLFTDGAESELARIDAQAAEVMRQDRLLGATRCGADAGCGTCAAPGGDCRLPRAHRRRARRAARRSAAQPHAAERDALNDERDGLARALALGAAGGGRAKRGMRTSRTRDRRAGTHHRLPAERPLVVLAPWLRVRLWWQRLRGE